MGINDFTIFEYLFPSTDSKSVSSFPEVYMNLCIYLFVVYLPEANSCTVVSQVSQVEQVNLIFLFPVKDEMNNIK